MHKSPSTQRRNPNTAHKSRNRVLIADTEVIRIRLRSITKKATTIPPLRTAIAKLHKPHTEEDLRTLLMLHKVPTGEVLKKLSQKNGRVKRMTLAMIRTFISTKNKHKSIRKNLMKLITIVTVSLSGIRRFSNLKNESNAQLNRVLNVRLSQKWSVRSSRPTQNRVNRFTQKNQPTLNRAIQFTRNKASHST